MSLQVRALLLNRLSFNIKPHKTTKLHYAGMRVGRSAGKVSPGMIKVVYDLNNFIVLAARLPQIFKNYKVSQQDSL